MNNPFNVNNPLNNFNMGNLQSAYQTLMNSRNPVQAFSQIAMNNPQMQPILQALNQGANPQQLFYSMCQQRGINPQQFINSITNKH